LSVDLLPVLIVGAPLGFRHRTYNTAVVMHRGRVLGVVPNSYLPTYREFHERRQIGAGDDGRGVIRIGGQDVPFGPDLLFVATDLHGFVLHVEICEDLSVPVPPSAQAALAGATLLANLSGSPITVGRAEDRCLLARSASARCLATYIYAAAGEGEGESTTVSPGTARRWCGRTAMPCSIRAVPQERSSLDRRCRSRPPAVRAVTDGHLRRQPASSSDRRDIFPPNRIRIRPACR
jgi:NAD+ synthase (glutamine-hydrolysing)